KLVGAHEYTWTERVARKLRAHRVLAAVVLAAIVVLSIVSAVSVQRIVRERDEAERQRTIALRHQRKAEQALAAADKERNKLLLANGQGALEVEPTQTLAWLKKYPEDGEL